MLATSFIGFFLLTAAIALVLAVLHLRGRRSLPSFGIADLWRWTGSVGPGGYAAVGIIGFALKHNLDRIVATLVFHRPYGIFNYWIPPVEALRISSITREDAVFLVTMLVISLPFVWIGLGMTLRRLRSADLPLWLIFLFFVPLVNIVFFIILSLIPESGSQDQRDEVRKRAGSPIPDSVLGSAAIAVALAGSAGALLVYVGVETLGVYGWGVFVALPFCMGLGSVMIYSYHRPRLLGKCLLVSLTTVTLASAVLFAVAVEGLICILMAIPVAVPLALLGGSAGFFIQRRRAFSAESPPVMLIVLMLPLTLMGFEKWISPEAEIITVSTSIRIEATAKEVWANLVSFPDLPEPNEWLFQLGVSRPIRATINGSGVGAVRECVFSTGTFVERIDGWEENGRMAFSVISGADAMQEFSPYDIRPRHLDGYLVPERAEFTLIPNPDGSTNLEGRSWYRNSMWPAIYWRLWSDQILHDIHNSVFEHIKLLSEAPTRTQRAR